ncbi:MAG: LD-carboxypeptidase [Bdellovibrionales bacterium]
MDNWPTLKPGDIIDVVAPASACKRSELNGAIRYLKKAGFKPRVPKNIFSGKSQLFAQTDKERLKQLVQALKAKDSKAVWCVRGGYGAIRLLPDLAKIKIPKTSKILVGYSDVTTLHSFLNANWRWSTLHGPLLDRFGRHANLPQETRELWGLLNGTRKQMEFTGLKPLNLAARKPRRLNGAVIGGNLTVLHSSLGTPWQVHPRGHMVFFEDLGERPHRLDRMLTQLTQAGFFKGAKAVLFGDILIKNSKDRRLIWQDVLPRFAASLKVPVLAGLPCGHGRIQRPLPLMTKAVLQTGGRGKLTVAAARK